jgi:hypothetical protein
MARNRTERCHLYNRLSSAVATAWRAAGESPFSAHVGMLWTIYLLYALDCRIWGSESPNS